MLFRSQALRFAQCECLGLHGPTRACDDVARSHAWLFALTNDRFAAGDIIVIDVPGVSFLYSL